MKSITLTLLALSMAVTPVFAQENLQELKNELRSKAARIRTAISQNINALDRRELLRANSQAQRLLETLNTGTNPGGGNNPNPGGGDPDPGAYVCQSTGDRMAAMRTIERIENSADDVREVFQFVDTLSIQNQICITDMANTYARVLREMGGSSNTQEAKNILNSLNSNSDFSRRPDHLIERVDNFLIINAKENKYEDALDGLKMVYRSKFRGRASGILAEYLKLLRQHGGSSNTAEAQSSFRYIENLDLRMPTSELVDLYITMMNAENQVSDAEGNLNLVVRAHKSSGESIHAVARNFLDLLRSNGGSSSTAEARSAFRLMYRI